MSAHKEMERVNFFLGTIQITKDSFFLSIGHLQDVEEF